jgi:hypothetical protein
MVGQPGWNNNPFGTMGHFEAGMGAHANMFGMHGPAGNYPYREQGLPTTPITNPLQLTVKQKMQELTNRACMGNLKHSRYEFVKGAKSNTANTQHKQYTRRRGEHINTVLQHPRMGGF